MTDQTLPNGADGAVIPAGGPDLLQDPFQDPLHELLQAFGQAMRQMMLRPEALDAGAMRIFFRLTSVSSRDEVLAQATLEATCAWLCRRQEDPAAHLVTQAALRLLDDAYWLQLALELLDAFFSGATLP